MPDNTSVVVSALGVQPVTIDGDGRQLGGGEYAVVNLVDKTTAAQVAAGNLGVVTRPDDPAELNDAAAAAFAHLDSLPRTVDPDAYDEEPAVIDPPDLSTQASAPAGDGEPAATPPGEPAAAATPKTTHPRGHRASDK